MEACMHVFQPVDPKDVDEGAYSFSGKSMLITSGNGEKVNSMTASWGGVGYLWNKRVTFIFVRCSRYTKEFIDASGEFSLSFMNQETYRGALKYLGSVSGRQEDKLKGARLNINYDDGIPFIDEAGSVITCKVLYQQTFQKDCITEEGIESEFYKDDDYHVMYVGEIKKIMVR